MLGRDSRPTRGYFGETDECEHDTAIISSSLTISPGSPEPSSSPGAPFLPGRPCTREELTD